MSLINHLHSVFPTLRQPSLAAVLVGLALLLANPQAQGQTFIGLHSFVGPEGQFPEYGLVRDSAGNLYGSTSIGGIPGLCDKEEGGGAVYKVEPSGLTTPVHKFNHGSDGCNPSGGLTIDSEGNLYGATSYSNIYKIDPAGNLTTIFQFTRQAQGTWPAGTLFRDSEGNLYGTTLSGGNDGCEFNIGCGTVFKVDANGTEGVLYQFTGGKDGAYPQAGVIRDQAGNFYGTATYGGERTCQNGCGVVFKVDPAGKQTVLHAFTGGADGRWPTSGLVLDAVGNLYGVTSGGGNVNCHAPFGCGSVYKITPSGEKSIFYAFQGGRDGAYPAGTLSQDSAGNFYGTTQLGGDGSNDGLVFKLDKTGRETILHRFNNNGGSSPVAGVILDPEGNLYGNTVNGGYYGEGVVFEIKRQTRR